MVRKTSIPTDGLLHVSKTFHSKLNPESVDGLQCQNSLLPFGIVHYRYKRFSRNVSIESIVIFLLVWCHRRSFACWHERWHSCRSEA